MKYIIFENRAWKGIRMVSTDINIKHRNIIFTIQFHHVKKQFMVEEEFKYLRRKNDTGTYGHYVFFGNTVKDCIDYIQDIYNIDVDIADDPEEIKWHENHNLVEG